MFQSGSFKVTILHLCLSTAVKMCVQVSYSRLLLNHCSEKQHLSFHRPRRCEQKSKHNVN